MKRIINLKRKIKSIFFLNSKSKSSFNEKILDLKYIIGNNVEFSNSEIGDYSYISPGSKIHSTNIGKYCSIGPNVITGYGEHPTRFLSTSPLFYYGTQKFNIKIAQKDHFKHHEPVVIKNDVWIGANVYIKNGVTIGNGAVIGAGSIVLKDVLDYAIVGGVPAKVIKYRFNDATIKKLLTIEWWNWDILKVKENQLLFVDEDIDAVLEKIKNEE